MILLLRLYWEFFKTGLFAVGGGLATLPFLSQMADKTGWFTQNELMNMVAVSESTPGAMGVNMATYVGFVTSGIPGALFATIGLITPSIIVILIIASFLKAFRQNRYVDSVFGCLRPASTGLIAASGLSVAALTFFGNNTLSFSPAALLSALNWKAVVLAAFLLLVTRCVKKTKGLHPIIWIALSAVVGIAFHFGGA